MCFKANAVLLLGEGCDLFSRMLLAHKAYINTRISRAPFVMIHVSLKFTGNREAKSEYFPLDGNVETDESLLFYFTFDEDLTDGRLCFKFEDGRLSAYNLQPGDMLVAYENNEVKSLTLVSDTWSGAFFVTRFFADGFKPNLFHRSITGTTDMLKTAELRAWLKAEIDAVL